jgi:hypothetical protein
MQQRGNVNVRSNLPWNKQRKTLLLIVSAIIYSCGDLDELQLPPFDGLALTQSFG